LETVRDKNKIKRKSRLRRHKRIRNKLFGTQERPRLCVYRSLSHIYAQIIDDSKGRTLVSASSLKAELPPPSKGGAGEDSGKKDEGKKSNKPESVKMRRSRAVGKAIADKALSKGIKQVSFDRGGFRYHGRIAALAEEARKSGLEL
jgi:large subunit ribosomal protein L18